MLRLDLTTMLPEFLGFLRCPQFDGRLGHEAFDCTGDEHIRNGVVWCVDCRNWYPIESELLDLLTGELAYQEERKSFLSEHRSRLEALGLRPDASISRPLGQKLQLVQQDHFDWDADNEEQDYHTYENQPFWLAADRLAFDVWRGEIKSEQWLLDVGCAEGRSLFKLIDVDLNIAGFDVSRRLIRQAVDRYHQHPHRAHANFLCADASRIPLTGNVMVYVLIYGVLHHLPVPAATCREVVRILKPGAYTLARKTTSRSSGAFSIRCKNSAQSGMKK